MIAFIDTEVGVDSRKVQDYGAICEDGATVHTLSAREFEAFVSMCDTVCGHNIIGHDLKYLQQNIESCILPYVFLRNLLLF